MLLRSLVLCSGPLVLATASLAQVVRSQVLLGPPFPVPLDGHFFGRGIATLGDIDGDGTLEIAVGEPSGVDPEHGATWLLSVDSFGNVIGMRRVSLLGNGSSGDRLGFSLANLGDIDGNGVPDLAMGAPGVLPNPNSAVLVALLESDKSTLLIQRHDAPAGSSGLCGRAVAGLGDLDGDGVPDMAIGDPNRGGVGAVWIEFLNANGTAKSRVRIDANSGGVQGLQTREQFGFALAAIGDLDGDGRTELAVGSPLRDDNFIFTDRGAVCILFLNANGSVRAQRRISSGASGFDEILTNGDKLGFSLALIGDLDGDGVPDLAAGAGGTDDGGLNTGAIFLFHLAPDGTVRSHSRISATTGGLHDLPVSSGGFGNGIAGIGDWNGDGIPDLAVAAPRDDRAGLDKGRLWLLGLEGARRIDFETEGDFQTALVNGQELSSPEEFSGLITLSSGGANLGPAIFDSTPSGPNAQSQDRDLLVGKGNVLILQNSQAPGQGVPDVFDHPNDDQDGGFVEFAFAQPLRLISVDLIDIDANGPASTFVTLRDASNRVRTYTVPRGWTEDLLANGPPGWRQLDLTTLAPQPGFGATVTASDGPGFDASRVVALRIALGGSGAVDDVVFDPAR